ncbi:two-component system response regulator [Paenibacillus sp. 32O-W]|uniref:response regulator transcription factor n=1 Tax=Paenibacillus sp. 32O-W TaxID=1695218 RepID=UPI00071F68A9|nr:response regulator [Paenibacillus sp. 32O-W]ALS26569.1 two-component system response regulator [Paenibacillus sp. 32O-W]
MNMKVIIVEDEPRVRKGLAETIDWPSFGMELVGTAANGLEGLELFRLHKPGLVVADIRMPVMDGLAMTEAILEIQPETKVIIISGHDEFQYAQKGISLGVTNYLLKPIGKARFQAELEKIRSELQKDLRQQAEMIDFELKMKSHLPILRNAFLEEWLTGEELKDEDVLKDSFSFLDIPFDFDREAAVAVFEVDWQEGMSNGDGRLLAFALHNIIEELIADRGISFHRGNGQTVVIYQPLAADLAEDLSIWAERTRVKIGALLKISLTAAVSAEAVKAAELPRIFNETLGILRLKLSLGTDTILHKSLVHPVQNPLALLNPSDEALLVQLVEMSDEAEIRRMIEALFRQWKEKKMLAYPDELSFRFAGVFTALAHRLGKSVRSFLNDEQMERWRHPERFRSPDELKGWWQQRFVELSKSYEGFRTDRKTKIVQQVMDYVDEHIYENITREDAARHVYINSSYLSRMFKKVTGESFSDFVIRKKMERAIHLLQVERVMVYEVADRLGYKDPSYFARVFKKYTGKSPSDFQE